MGQSLSALRSGGFKRLATACVRMVMENQYLAGMLVMAAGPAIAQSWWVIVARISRVLAGMAWTRVTIGKSEAEDLREWLRSQPKLHKGSNLKLCPRSDADSDSSASDHRIFDYEPVLETSFRVRFRSTVSGRVCYIWLEMPTAEQDPSRDDAAATITVMGRDKSVIKELLMEGRRLKRDKLQKFLHVITVYNFKQDNYGLGWNHGRDTDKKPPGRSIDSVILAPRRIYTSSGDSKEVDQARALLEDAREFLGAERWYADRGIPYRRGYLLHGMPGGGKSSLVMAVASELKLPIYLLTLSSDQMCDDALLQLMQTMTTTPSILLLEDVDAAHTAVAVREVGDGAEEQEKQQTVEAGAAGDQSVATGMVLSITEHLMEQSRFESKQRAREREQEREEGRDKKGGGHLTLSGLLNALDGPTATMGRLLFMTTNHKSLIDSALLRAGRIDYELAFGPVTETQCARLFSRFYCDYSSAASESDTAKSAVALRGKQLAVEIESMAEQFAETVHSSGLELSAADVQGHFMRHKSSPGAALRTVASELLGASSMEGLSASDENELLASSEEDGGDVVEQAAARAEIASLRQAVAAAHAELKRVGAMASRVRDLELSDGLSSRVSQVAEQTRT